MLYDLLKSRRSVRKYEDAPIEKEKVDIILKSALLSPSSRAARSWQFVCVDDREVLQKLSRCKEKNAGFLEGAPLGIVIAADSEISDAWVEDASIAATMVQLTAHSLGLGSCWIQVRNRFFSGNAKAEDYIRDILGIPEKYGVLCIIAIGCPAEGKKPYEESSLPYDKLHWNKF